MATAASRKRPGWGYSVAAYREQRQRIPAAELAKHTGKWAAFSRDGRRVVASAKDLQKLEKKLVDAGEDPQTFVYEFVGDYEFSIGDSKTLAAAYSHSHLWVQSPISGLRQGADRLWRG